EPTASDNCAVATFTSDYSPGDTFPLGTTAVTYTATDGNGQTVTCTFNVTVEDNEVPTITCAADQTQNTDAGNCTAVVTVVAPTTADNCVVASVTNNFNGTADASGTYPIGTTTVVWTVTDNSGNIATCSMDITVTDNEAPNAVCQDITASVDASGNLTITGDDVDGGSTDNCTGMTLSVSPNTFDCTDTGTTVTVTLTATDAAGLTDTCTANVTIIDQVAPTAVCQDITVQLDATGNVTITAADVDNGSSDACGGAVTLALTPSSSFDCNDLGANTVTLFVTDASGNSSFCTATVTVEDSVAPTITCAADQTQNLDAGLCTADVTVAGPTISDNCSVASITNDFNNTADASDDYPLGTTTVTWTLTDGSGNTATCTQDIVITDNQAPVAVCQDITVQLDATGAVTINASDLDGGSTDCSSMTFAVSPSSTFDCDDIGTNTVTLFVTDAAGNIGFCAAVVTVEDSIDPTIVSIPGDIAVNNDPGACGAVVSWTEPTTTDNCSSTISQTTGVANGSQFPVGATIVTYVATDTAGNTTQDTFTVTVTDIEGPSISCPANISVPGTSSAGAVVTFTTPVGTDQCSGSVTTQTTGLPSGSTFPLGTTTNTFEVEDPSGLTSSCSFTVEVTGVPPSIVCPANITVVNDSDSCDAIVTFAATDTTGVPTSVITYSQDPGTAFPVGTTTVTATATNSLGTDQCTFTITVNDTQNPAWVVAPSDLTVQCDGSGNTTEFNDWLNNTFTGSDNCTVVTVTNDSTGLSDDCGATGTETVTFTLTDSNTNSITLDATFTIEDTTVPTLTTAAANSTVQCDGTSDP
ncbi:HYR domain-containing protein, partial [Flavobacteriaceae bacterium]|nr:HYR domain-containing protein [Flavobacteriaceae bacterium]